MEEEGTLGSEQVVVVAEPVFRDLRNTHTESSDDRRSIQGTACPLAVLREMKDSVSCKRGGRGPFGIGLRWAPADKGPHPAPLAGLWRPCLGVGRVAKLGGLPGSLQRPDCLQPVLAWLTPSSLAVGLRQRPFGGWPRKSGHF